jgi:hypothetical protein
MNPTLLIENEFELIFSYLNVKSLTVANKEKYQKGVEILSLQLNVLDSKILNFILKKNRSIQIVDCGLSLFLRDSNLKKRFLLASSIVESSPESFDDFLNSERIKFAKIKLIYVGISTVFTMVLAIILFRFKHWK